MFPDARAAKQEAKKNKKPKERKYIMKRHGIKILWFGSSVLLCVGIGMAQSFVAALITAASIGMATAMAMIVDEWG